MFRRTKSPSGSTAATSGGSSAVDRPAKPGGKGRPTPTRKEAQAAARERARGPKDRKAAAKLERRRRAEESARMRQGLKSGDERLLPRRDQGAVRRFLRDRVDARLSMAEFLLPLLIIIMVLSYTGSPRLVALGQSLWLATIVLVSLDTVLLVIKIKRELRRRFPHESHKGAVFYSLLRAMQLRFLRLPKPMVKLGQPLPERY